MDQDGIRESIESLVAYLGEHPEKWRNADPPATAVMIDGLRCRAEGPGGASIVSDMPRAVGGGDSAPRPGWFMRAALATCDATVIAMRAAQLGIALDRLEVAVESESDPRGLLGIDDTVVAGPVRLRMRVTIAAAGVPAEQVREIVAWADRHSPVGDALRRAIPVEVEVLAD
jgi:uncharacterized OsmC-like protein